MLKLFYRYIRCFFIICLVTIINAQDIVHDDLLPINKHESINNHQINTPLDAIKNIDTHESVKERLRSYQVLRLNKNATIEDIERAYYVRTSKNHKIIDSVPRQLHYDATAVIPLYGTSKDVYERTLNNTDYYNRVFVLEDQAPEKIFAAQKDLHDVRQAFECLTETKLTRIKRELKLFSTKDLNQKELRSRLNKIYVYRNDPTCNFRTVIEQMRQEQALDSSIAQLDEEDFVVGEPDQSLSLLTPADRDKAQLYNSAEQKEKVANYLKQQARKDREDVGFGIMVAGAAIAIPAIIYSIASA